MMSDRPAAVTVRVPATTANLGPGYDCLGLALGLHNEVTLALADEPTVAIEGEGAQSLPRDGGHLVLEAARAATEAAGAEPPALSLHQANRIPLARGGLSVRRVLDIATGIEGHPDNVAPALLGGLTVCCTVGDEVLVERLEVAPGLSCVVAVPDFEVPTHDARRVLPDTVTHADAVFNLCRASLIVAALVSGDFAVLGEAMRDRLHQPYRAHLVPGMEEAIAAALATGAHGAALSGSGPTIAAFVGDAGEEVGRAMVNAFERAGVAARTRALRLSSGGAAVIG